LAVAKTIYLGGPVKTAGKATIATRWVGEIPAATTTAVTILSRSSTNGARPAVLTVWHAVRVGTNAYLQPYRLYGALPNRLDVQPISALETTTDGQTVPTGTTLDLSSVPGFASCISATQLP
jgi:hypothetical protein